MEGQRAQSVAGPIVRMFGGSGGRAAGRMRQRQARTLQELGQRRLLSAAVMGPKPKDVAQTQQQTGCDQSVIRGWYSAAAASVW